MNGHPHSSMRAVIRPAILSIWAALFLTACDAKDPIAPVPTVAGTITSSATGKPVAGAVVSIGDAVVTTGANGRFELTDLTAGAATLRCTATGFTDFQTPITVTSGSVAYDIGLSRIEVFEFGDFALYVPASVDATRGLILALGGPDTRGFATAKPMGAPIPAVEASLQALGQEFRTLASTRALAILGTSRAAMTNGPDSDQLLFAAVKTAAALSGRTELEVTPVILYGMSGGAPQASGFTTRNPGEVAGLFLKVPAAVSSLSSGSVLQVPTYMVLAELDAFVNNIALSTAFEGNRDVRALWGLALEPGVAHHSLTATQRQVTINWMNTILAFRLPADPWSHPLRDIAETSGWLGNRATGEVAPFDEYPGDRSSASWLPSESTAKEWKTLVAR